MFKILIIYGVRSLREDVQVLDNLLLTIQGAGSFTLGILLYRLILCILLALGSFIDALSVSLVVALSNQ